MRRCFSQVFRIIPAVGSSKKIQLLSYCCFTFIFCLFSLQNVAFSQSLNTGTTASPSSSPSTDKSLSKSMSNTVGGAFSSSSAKSEAQSDFVFKSDFETDRIQEAITTFNRIHPQEKITEVSSRVLEILLKNKLLQDPVKNPSNLVMRNGHVYRKVPRGQSEFPDIGGVSTNSLFSSFQASSEVISKESPAEEIEPPVKNEEIQKTQERTIRVRIPFLGERTFKVVLPVLPRPPVVSPPKNISTLYKNDLFRIIKAVPVHPPAITDANKLRSTSFFRVIKPIPKEILPVVKLPLTQISPTTVKTPTGAPTTAAPTSTGLPTTIQKAPIGNATPGN